MVSTIIDIINGGFVGLTDGEKYYGLAQTVIRTQGSETEVLPGLVAADGEIQYVGIDDVYSIIVYHKLNSITATRIANGRGDYLGDMQYAYTMAMYVYWDRKRLHVLPDELLLLLQSRFPNKVLQAQDIKSINMQLSNINTNSLQIFSQEYAGIAFTLPANKSLMQINYSVNLIFNPACLPVCL